MKINRKYSIAIGVLFLLAMASYMIGSEIVVSSLDIANGFANINVNTLKFGIVLEFITSTEVVGTPSLMWGDRIVYVSSSPQEKRMDRNGVWHLSNH